MKPLTRTPPGHGEVGVEVGVNVAVEVGVNVAVEVGVNVAVEVGVKVRVTAQFDVSRPLL
jgi:hypothetical protein